MTSSLAVFEASIRVKSTHLIKSCFKTRKKHRKYGNKRNFFYINHHLKVRFGHRIHSLLRRADARGSAEIRFRLGLRPRPRWGSLQRSPRPPSWISGVLLLRGWKVQGNNKSTLPYCPALFAVCFNQILHMCFLLSK